MAEETSDAQQFRTGRRRRRHSPEERWVRSFLEYAGTENVTRFCPENLQGVSLTRAVQALARGFCVSAEKCDGAGSVCVFEDADDDIGAVEVTVFFIASEEVLEIRGARVKEKDSEPNAA